MPRLPSFAVAFAVGVGCASTQAMFAPGPHIALAMWVAGVLGFLGLAQGLGRDLDQARAPWSGRAAVWVIRALAWLLAALCAGGLCATTELLRTRGPSLPASAVADDHALDTVIGVVRGPLSRTDSGLRFVVHLDAPASARVEVGAEPGVEVWPGDRVAVVGWLRAPRGYRVSGAVPAARLLRLRGADLSMRARTVEVLEPAAVATVWRLAAQTHERLRERIRDRGGPDAGNAVVRAMVVGDRGGLGPGLAERWRDAGVAHVLAVSGLHLAVVALFVFALVRRAWAAVPGLAMRVRPDIVAACAALPLAVGYALVTGGRASTLRALLVIVIVLVGVLLTRRARMLDALGAAAIVLLAYRPESLYDPGFQLSFAAATTLVLVARPRPRGVHGADPESRGRRLARRLWRALVELGRASFFATLATAPLCALGFGTVAFAGLFSNLLAVPLTELVIVPLGLAGALVSELWPAGGGGLLDLVIHAAGALDAVLAEIARAAPAVRVFPPNAWELLGALLVWAGAVAWARASARTEPWPRGSRPAWRGPRLAAAALGLGLALIAGSYAWSVHLEPRWRTNVRVTFLDVGQGDAAVIELPGGAVWMIDGGGLPFVSARVTDERERRRLAESPGRLSVARFLDQRRIRRIDLLVLSHPHPDHFEGVHALAGSVPVGTVWVASDQGRVSPSYRDLLREFSRAGTVIEHPVLGRALAYGPVSLTALAPRHVGERASHDPVAGHNDNSLVVRLDAYGRRVLFTGDIEREGEDLLLAHHGPDLRADVVKVPHHGSSTSSSAGLVAATAPALAVVSCGAGNRFGFPAPRVVERWQAAGARVLRTDVHGAITVDIAPGGGLRTHVFDP